jgi:hypothetical protein
MKIRLFVCLSSYIFTRYFPTNALHKFLIFSMRVTCYVYLILVDIIIISCSTVLVRILAASHGRIRNLFRHTIGLLWTSDNADAEASTYTGQHNI